ncbi:MAG: hypothetical protein KDD89_15290 [Anaerolineales bacterium]|nr:hypothetical protein [Anaerolineales bacterium]
MISFPKLRLALLTAVALLLLAVMFARNIFVNYVSWQMNVYSAKQLPPPAYLEQWLVRSLAMLPPHQQTNAYRHLGQMAVARGDVQLAATYWQKGALPVQDAAVFGDKLFRQRNLPSALLWYELATLLEPDNAELWLDVGLVCQNGFWDISICQQFLEVNQLNYLINADLLWGDLGWHTTYEEAAEHAVEPCPDAAEVCLKIAVVDELADGPSWAQCLHLPPQQTYQFSAWLLVDAEPDESWRPMYHQGRIAGEVKGSWPQTMQGMSPWTLWEQEVSVGDFDDYRVCFHPIRLAGGGTAWIHSPQLVAMRDE